MKFLFYIILFISIHVSLGTQLSFERIMWQLEGGNLRNIEHACEEFLVKHMSKILRYSDEELFVNKEILLACYIGRYSQLLQQKGVMNLHDFKDKQYGVWLVSDPKIWEDFVFARSMHPDTLNILKNIWLVENKNLNGIHLNMALGASLSEKKIEECIGKYQYYKKAYNQNKLFKQFKELEPWEFKLLFDGRESVSELEWAQEFVSQKKKFKPWNAASVACRWIPYREKNSKGISVHKGAAFYDFKPISLKIYVEYGGVCGAVSKGAAGFLRAKGVPAYTIGQPEHCAFIWKNPRGRWVIRNDIHGWGWSEGGKGIPWKGPSSIIQAMSQFKSNPKARASTFFYELSELDGLVKYKTILLDKALSLNFCNYEAWKEYFNTRPAYQSLDSLKQDFVKFQKVFPENNRLWYDILYKYINTGKLNKYEVCSLLLGDEPTDLSEQVYMKKYFLLLKSDIDGFQKKWGYTPKVEKKYLMYYQSISHLKI